MQPIPHNRGFIEEKELADKDPRDHILGATSQQCLYRVPEDKREQYLPKGERQDKGEEKSFCVTAGYLNNLEDKFTYAYKNGLMEVPNMRWLEDNGYIEDDRVVFSDSFNAILSGTTRGGNSMHAPADSIRKDGLVPKSKLPQLSTFQENNNPKRITPELKALGKSFLERWTIKYDQPVNGGYSEYLAKDSYNGAVHAWPEPVNGEYTSNLGSLNHAIMFFKNPAYHIFDNYEESTGDFIKKLAPDYIVGYPYRIYVASETTPEDRRNSELVFLALVKNGLVSFFAKFWQLLTTTQPKMEPVKEETLSKIPTMAKAIEVFESGGKPDALNMRNRNPGNIKNVDGTFKKFATYDEGFQYLVDYITRAATGKHKAYPKDCNMRQFFDVYAPDGDKIVSNYTTFVCNRVGVFPSTKLKDLL